MMETDNKQIRINAETHRKLLDLKVQAVQVHGTMPSYDDVICDLIEIAKNNDTIYNRFRSS
ncbi:hypothetical protein [Tsuneonella sp. HG222]